MTTLTYCVLIERPDGVKLGFTSFNQDISINSVLYKANSAVDPTAVSSKADLSADNIELESLLDNEDLKPQELIAGLYDESRVTCALVDFINKPSTLNDAIVLLKGRIGQVRITDTSFTFEVRSLSELANRPINYRTSPTCPYAFGDSKCQKDLASANLLLTDIDVTAVSELILTLDTNLLTDNFIGGVLTFKSGNNNRIRYEIVDVPANNQVEIEGELAGAIAVDDVVDVRAACGKTAAACKAYSNFINFGGVPVGGRWVPGLEVITVPR
ncbi:DUF2163 domain-containing protein [Myxosarcina sp. GI1(2024)]